MSFRIFKNIRRSNASPPKADSWEASQLEGAFGFLNVLIAAAAIFGIGGAAIGVYYLSSSWINDFPASPSEAAVSTDTGSASHPSR